MILLCSGRVPYGEKVLKQLKKTIRINHLNLQFGTHPFKQAYAICHLTGAGPYRPENMKSRGFGPGRN